MSALFGNAPLFSGRNWIFQWKLTISKTQISDYAIGLTLHFLKFVCGENDLKDAQIRVTSKKWMSLCACSNGLGTLAFSHWAAWTTYLSVAHFPTSLKFIVNHYVDGGVLNWSFAFSCARCKGVQVRRCSLRKMRYELQNEFNEGQGWRNKLRLRQDRT